ncbi:NYN domain-containing protein [Dethiobacter alkaliphilus]|uniref:NYN domain-containing protein n=1 Tax=Dethiobacter alkaliphilus TaxID=427926 RepID=UPI002225CE96|nr:NYN domain-containing protein [Dethiobacter alkaliphilus]MCW3491064.1 NYN domain-containing protein [Dethiobacter alkaliphilus]
MASVLLVDGYNVIGNWEELSALKSVSLEDARAKLCGILIRYLKFRWDRIIVVFDAYRVSGGKEKDPGDAPFAVIFSDEGETADVVIERLTAQLVAAGNVVEVATSDALEQSVVLRLGATRISSRELRLQLGEMDRQLSEANSGDRGRRMVLDIHLDPKTREVLERWRRKS